MSNEPSSLSTDKVDNTDSTMETPMVAMKSPKEVDIAWIESQLKELPIWTRNQPLCQKALDIAKKWIVLFSHDFNTWRRIKKRIAKELNESEPCITYIMDFVSRRNTNQSTSLSPEKQEEKFTIVDICCGFGITSMFLSELLPPEWIDKIWLVDYNFPCHSEANPPHVKQIFYEREWPVPLRIRKVNMKKSREIKNLHNRILNVCPGPILMFGIHLCKALSVHAINLYQNCPKAKLLVLKPCCLPGKDKQFVRKGEPIMWKFMNGYEFGPRDIYCTVIKESNTVDSDKGNSETNGNINYDDQQESMGIQSDDEEVKQNDSLDSDDEGDNDYSDRPHGGRKYSSKLFSRWIHFLERACQDDHTSIVKRKHTNITLHYFQNDFIYCERQEQQTKTMENSA